ncbi:MAG: hypothetical protein ASARMPRED_004594 [Alectoria sarmentosa]|nr:MAG: hypothetical protein ASARMPRED_004594 [Alectoria sarmentosa]
MTWFSRARELDEKRGTQLGTLGFLPWEIRQTIIEKVFDREFHETIYLPEFKRTVLETLDNPPKTYFEDDFPYSWRSGSLDFYIAYLRNASASTKVEVEYTFLTKTNFKFRSPNALIYFLGRLTTYQQNLLRSITIPLCTRAYETDITAGNQAWMDAYAHLPSGLTSIKFGLDVWSLDAGRASSSEVFRELLRFLELRGKQIKRRWTPRAKIDMDLYEGGWYGELTIEKANNLASVLNEVEDWNKEWLECWETSQDGDQGKIPRSMTTVT